MTLYSSIFALYAFSHLFLLFWMVKYYFKNGHLHSLTAYYIAYGFIGLIYDNGILGFGHYLRDFEYYKALNYPRFFAHEITGAFAILMFGLFAAKSIGGFFSGKAFLSITTVLFLIVLGLGIKSYVGLNLVPAEVNGVYRYTFGGGGGPGLIFPLKFGFIFLVSLAIFIKTKNKVLFLGMLTTFSAIILSKIYLSYEASFVLGNAYEIIYMLSILYTEKFTGGITWKEVKEFIKQKSKQEKTAISST